MISILDIDHLIPKGSLEIDLQIEHRGKVKFEAVSYDEKNSRQILKKGEEVALPFKPPFEMKIRAVSLYIGDEEK